MTQRIAAWAKLACGLTAVFLSILIAGCPTKPPANGTTGAEQTGVEPAGDANDKPTGDKPSEDDPAGADDSQGAAAEDAAKYDPLFVDWPEPQAALVLTGRQHGYVEPCGCTGLDNQKGGLARRHVLLNTLRGRGWEIAALDVGSQVRRYGAQAELKFQMSADALQKMEYKAVAFGGEDLRLSIDALIAASTEGSPFISANASILGLSGGQRIFEIGGRKIGVTAVLGAAQQKSVNNDEVETKTIPDALPQAIAKLKAAECDYIVLLAHTTLEEARALVPDYTDVDLIVTSGGADLPAYRPDEFKGSKTRMVQVGAKGMYAGVLAFYDDEETPFRFERVPLDGRFSDSPEMLRLMKNYQQQLEKIGLDKLGVRPLPHPTGRKYMGSESCKDCHTYAYEVWSESDHAHATMSIKEPYERSEIPRHHDPECISCHVTGWNPQKYTPYLSGYTDFAKSAKLHGSGCENCHGPGSEHVAAENGDVDVSDEELINRRMGMRLAKDDARKKCLECHDLDNSPDFHEPGAFERFWADVDHNEDESD